MSEIRLKRIDNRKLTTFCRIQELDYSPRASFETKRWYFVAKRLLDVLISVLVVLFILSWLFPILALLIRIESRGPVLFIQRRVGKGGKSFRCLKFRTMVVNELANSAQAQVNDRRITTVGHFLRLSNLDEFPQFLNVLAGQMSIVGPRPHMHSDCTKFSAVVTGYKLRNMVKPGITGLAQVKGYRGPTTDFKSIFHRYQFDAFYVRNANFWLDMRIIRKTAGQTLRAILGKLSRMVTKILTAQPLTSGPRGRWIHAIRGFLS